MNFCENRRFSKNIMPYLLFLKKQQNLKLLQIIGGALRVNKNGLQCE